MASVSMKHLWSRIIKDNKYLSLFCLVVAGMLPGFPPGVFPFWGPFPAVPPPAAPPSAADAPPSSTEASQASGKEIQKGKGKKKK